MCAIDFETELCTLAFQHHKWISTMFNHFKKPVNLLKAINSLMLYFCASIFTIYINIYPYISSSSLINQLNKYIYMCVFLINCGHARKELADIFKKHAPSALLSECHSEKPVEWWEDVIRKANITLPIASDEDSPRFTLRKRSLNLKL